MSSTRPRRSAAAPPAPVVVETPRRSRSTRNVKPEPEPEPEVEDDAEGEDDAEETLPEEEGPAAGPSRSRARGGSRKSRGRGGGRSGGRAKRQVTEEEADGTEDEEKPYRVRSRKSVSYREVPVEELEEEVEDEEGDEVGEEDGTPPPARKSSQAPDTPSRRRKATVDLVEEKEDKPYKFEKVGSGRGGFSVKGAAAAAARARWAKVRREKAERGEDDDGDRRKSRPSIRRENKAAVEKLKDGEVVNIRGTDYTAHNDELTIPDDAKGETKIDAEGRLQGGREYKVFTFSSEGRDNAERLYGLTIDVARACGYSDSLAFLRRFPIIQKLQCQPGEAEMLIDVGRVSGNMKHRMVTIIPMRNVFKLMGARIIKNAKWVTDDYYEEEALAKCAENGYTPYAPAHEEEIMANAASNMNRGDREREALTSVAKSNILSPFYTLGGPSTHFAGSGIDPWTEGGWGNRRAKLRGVGVTEEDWMYRTALDCRTVDSTLRSYREERIGTLEGDDLKGWVWTNENKAEVEEEGEEEKMEVVDSPKIETSTLGLGNATGLKPPMERKRSALSREVTFEPDQPTTDEALTPLPATDADVSMEASEVVQTPAEEVEGEDPISAALGGINGRSEEGEVRVETEEDRAKHKAKWGYGTGSWEQGTIRAAYEPHTHMPHVPLFTQPQSADFVRASPYPILQSVGDNKHQNFVQSTVRGRAARGLASIEYVFDPLVDGSIGWDRTAEDEMRKRMVEEAVEWEARNREKRRRTTASVAV